MDTACNDKTEGTERTLLVQLESSIDWLGVVFLFAMKTNRAIEEFFISAMYFYNTTSGGEEVSFTNFTTTSPNNELNGSNVSTAFVMTSEFRHPPGITALYIIVYCIAFLFALLGNVIVIAVVLRYRWMHTVTNFFIVNLAIADILMAIFCIPITMLIHIFVGK